MLIWINGKIREEHEAILSPFDRGFTLADGVFETIRASGSTPLWLQDHIERLTEGANCLGIPPPAHEEIREGISLLLSLSKSSDSAVRVTLTRGASRRRGLWPPDDDADPTRVITTAPFPTAPPQRVAIARTTRRNEYSPLSRIKSLAYGDNILARREALDRDYTDAVVLNASGKVACCTVGNLFIRVGLQWITPPASDGALPGLARKRAINMLNGAEVSISEPLLREASAAFISNSLNCAPIVEIEGKKLEDVSVQLDFASVYTSEDKWRGKA